MTTSRLRAPHAAGPCGADAVGTARALLLLGALLLASPASAQQPYQMPSGTSSISGHVIAGDSNKPIRGALVEIVIYENLSGRFKQTTTDADGKFTFTNLPAGHYQLTASATRYLRMYFGQAQPGPSGMLNPARTIELGDGQPFPSADFTLSRFCAIEGTVVDEFGDPAPNVAMQVSQVMYGGGRKRLAPTSPSMDAGPIRPTDDKGQFRVGGLAPGEYYVEALSGAFADPNAAGGFAVTFFPGTSNSSNAQAVSVKPGHDTLNVSFALTPAPVALVSGTLVDDAGRPLGGGNLMLVPSERSGTPLVVMAQSGTDSGGRFTFRNVPPGSYTIQAFGGQHVGSGGNLNAYAFGYLTFTVDGHDLDQLTVKVPAPRTLRGHVTFEGDTSVLPKPDEVQISPRPMDFESAPMAGGPSPSTVHDDWTFEVGAMSGLRMVTAGARPGWIMKRATLKGVDVTDTPLDLREHDVNDLEIVLTTQTTTVTGTVTGPDDKPLADYSVVIFADDDTKWSLWSRYVAYARPGQQGMFTVKGLPAGAYVAIATDTLANGEWQDPEFLQKQRAIGNAARFTLLDGGSKTLQLTTKR